MNAFPIVLNGLNIFGMACYTLLLYQIFGMDHYIFWLFLAALTVLVLIVAHKSIRPLKKTLMKMASHASTDRYDPQIDTLAKEAEMPTEGPNFSNCEIVASPYCPTRGVAEIDGMQYIVQLRYGQVTEVIVGPIKSEMSFEVAGRALAGAHEHVSINVAMKSMAATMLLMSKELTEAYAEVMDLKERLSEEIKQQEVNKAAE